LQSPSRNILFPERSSSSVKGKTILGESFLQYVVSYFIPAFQFVYFKIEIIGKGILSFSDSFLESSKKGYIK